MSSIDFQSALAFFPTYSEQGLVSKVVYGTQEVVLELTLNTLVKQACRQYALDKKALGNAAKFVSGKPHLVPLPLAVNRTFAPLKVHSPLVQGDPAYGYFRIQAILKIDADKDGSKVILLNGMEVPLAQNRSAALAHIARALLFERVFWSKRLGTSYGDRKDFSNTM